MNFPSSTNHGVFSASNLPQPGVDLGSQSIASKFETERPTRLPDFHCLIADDSHGQRAVLQAIIVSLGGAVDLVVDGSEATEAALGRDYDLILMDVTMPGLDGLSAVRLIRQIEAHTGRRRSSIFMVTSHDAPADILTAIGVGADGVVSKPIKVSNIINAARQAVSARRAGRLTVSTEG